MKKSNKKGFTIVELVIVIAVIAILAAVLIPTFASVTNRAKESKAMQQARIAYENYLADHADKADLKKDICIEVGEYHFHVVDGQFVATNNECNDNETTFTHYSVTGNNETFDTKEHTHTASTNT